MDRCWLALAIVVGLIAGCNTPKNRPAIVPAPPDELWQGKIVLGSPSLTAGIPGDGPLTLDQIRTWLANPANHEPLDFALPLGLRSAESPTARDFSLTRAKIELGRQLFFDRRLSRAGTLACIDCHHPQRQFTSDEIAHQSLRETAVAFNRILGQEQFWDGRAKSLEDQLRSPLENVHEMNHTAAECVDRIRGIAGYRLQFEAIFGQVDFESLCAAVAAFERVIVTGPSPWDYDVELRRLKSVDPIKFTAQENAWVAQMQHAAEAQPLSAAARRGSELFFSDRGGCSRCHTGPNFTDEHYHDIGLRVLPAKNQAQGSPPSATAQKEAADLGRFQITGMDADRHAFKTPTLRNVALTWPYFHDGRHHELRNVVEHFVRGGDVPGTAIQPLDLNKDEINDLVEFLKSLTGSLPQPVSDRLPP